MSENLSFTMLAEVELTDAAVYPAGARRLLFRSAYDGETDWAIFVPGDTTKNTVVYLHGAFSEGDQLFTRRDVRDFWLTRVLAGRHPLLSINMRGTSFMNPAATRDFSDLLDYCRSIYHCGKVVLLGGSGGAFSAMSYACLHPERIDGVIAMGMCDIYAFLANAEHGELPVLRELHRVILQAYGGVPEANPAVYRPRSVLANVEKLTMPVVLTMGEDDTLIPVAETRKIADAMHGRPAFTYREIPHGDHDAALWVDVDLETLLVR